MSEDTRQAIRIVMSMSIKKDFGSLSKEVEYDVLSNTSIRIKERQQGKHRRSESNVQRNESLAKYFASLQILNYCLRMTA
jgi:hypothetical protein